jgi:hypothetical protein
LDSSALFYDYNSPPPMSKGRLSLILDRSVGHDQLDTNTSSKASTGVYLALKF